MTANVILDLTQTALPQCHSDGRPSTTPRPGRQIGHVEAIIAQRKRRRYKFDILLEKVDPEPNEPSDHLIHVCMGFFLEGKNLGRLEFIWDVEAEGDEEWGYTLRDFLLNAASGKLFENPSRRIKALQLGIEDIKFAKLGIHDQGGGAWEIGPDDFDRGDLLLFLRHLRSRGAQDMMRKA